MHLKRAWSRVTNRPFGLPQLPQVRNWKFLQSSVTQFERQQPEFMYKNLMILSLDFSNTGVRNAFTLLISFFGGNLQNILNSSCHYWCVIKWHTNVKLVFQYYFPRVIICNWREIRVSPTLRWWSYHTIIYDSYDNHTHNIIRSKRVFLSKDAD